MGYLHINNLYKDQRVFEYSPAECYVLEKIHGTSSSICYKNGEIHYHSGGEKYEKFVKLFNNDQLLSRFKNIFEKYTKEGKLEVVVYGEAYGGSQQKMAETYGKDLKFIAFDVLINDDWCNVVTANNYVKELGLEFVFFERIPTTLENLNNYKDRPSEQAKRNGCGDKPAEGIIIRPLVEASDKYGERVITKYKRDDFAERKTPQKIVDPSKIKILQDAQEIATEWVVPMRLEHVLQKLPQGIGLESTKLVIDAMTEDVLREAAGEIVDSPETRKEICRQTAILFKKYVTNVNK